MALVVHGIPGSSVVPCRLTDLTDCDEEQQANPKGTFLLILNTPNPLAINAPYLREPICWDYSYHEGVEGVSY